MGGAIGEILVNLIPAVIAAAVASVITVRLSLKKFQSQRWWEKKADAYSRILKELSCLQMCFDDWFRDATHEMHLSDERKEQRLQEYRHAREWVERAAATGAFVVSQNTADALSQLLTDLAMEDREGDWVRDLDRHYGAVRRAINSIRGYAMYDLELKSQTGLMRPEV